MQYRWHGRDIARAVQAYGASILLFGLVLLIGAFSAPASETAPHVALIVAACVALALSGASDNVSSIYRNTMMQAAVPDAMRGRLQGLFIVVVAGGPRVGALYAGTLATLTTLWFPPLLGGVLVIRTRRHARAPSAVGSVTTTQRTPSPDGLGVLATTRTGSVLLQRALQVEADRDVPCRRAHRRVSSAAFQVRPKSSRLMTVLAEAPAL